MGQCPVTLDPEDHTKNYKKESMIQIVMDMLTCDQDSLESLYKSDQDRMDFIVSHSYDSTSLISKDKLEQVFARENALRDIIHKCRSKPDEDDRKSDFTSITAKTRNTSNVRGTKTIVEEYYALENSGSMPEYNFTQLQTAEKQTNIRCGVCFGDGEYIPKPNALHLTKKAHIANFYRTKYAPDEWSKLSLPSNPFESRNDSYIEVTENVPNLVLAQSIESELTNNSNPAKENSDPINLHSDGSSFLNLSMSGSLGLAQHEKETLASGLSPSKVKRKSIYDTRLFLQDENSNKLVAMCCLNLKNGDPCMTVYSPLPKSEGQYPAMHVSFEGKRLYRWAEITARGEFPFPVRYSIHLTGCRDIINTEPSYRACHVKAGNPNIQVVGRTEGEHHMTGCCSITLEPSLHDDGGNFSIVVARGVDPTLFICLTAFMDELLESSMRRVVARRERREQQKVL